MKKIIFYCTLMFSSMIAVAIIMYGSLLSEDLGWDFISVILVIFLILIALSIVLALIEAYKKDKSNKE